MELGVCVAGTGCAGVLAGFWQERAAKRRPSCGAKPPVRSRPGGRRVSLAAFGGSRRGRRRTQWAASSLRVGAADGRCPYLHGAGRRRTQSAASS